MNLTSTQTLNRRTHVPPLHDTGQPPKISTENCMNFNFALMLRRLAAYLMGAGGLPRNNSERFGIIGSV